MSKNSLLLPVLVCLGMGSFAFAGSLQDLMAQAPEKSAEELEKERISRMSRAEQIEHIWVQIDSRIRTVGELGDDVYLENPFYESDDIGALLSEVINRKFPLAAYGVSTHCSETLRFIFKRTTNAIADLYVIQVSGFYAGTIVGSEQNLRKALTELKESCTTDEFSFLLKGVERLVDDYKARNDSLQLLVASANKVRSDNQARLIAKDAEKRRVRALEDKTYAALVDEQQQRQQRKDACLKSLPNQIHSAAVVIGLLRDRIAEANGILEDEARIESRSGVYNSERKYEAGKAAIRAQDALNTEVADYRKLTGTSISVNAVTVPPDPCK